MKVNFSKIEQLAEEQGISLNALAIKMGKNRYFLYNVRDRKQVMKMPDIRTLATILNTNAEYLLDETEDSTSRISTFGEVKPSSDISVLEFADMLATRPQTQVLFSALKNASDEDIAKVISILKVLKGEANDQ